MSHYASTKAARRKRAVESFRVVSECLGPIEREMSLFAITRGQFSMLDVIVYCLDQVGPSRVSVWTFSLGAYDVACLAALRADQRITEGRLVVDYQAKTERPESLAAWRAAFGPLSVRYVVSHSKMVTIASVSGLRLLCRGSFNFNHNTRFEQLDLTEGGPEFDLVDSIEARLPVLDDSSTMADAYRGSQLDQAYSGSELKVFRGVKQWRR